MELYSQEYLKQIKNVHATTAQSKGFGNKVKKIKEFEACLKKWRPRSLLDFGCGKGALLQYLRQQYPNIHCIGYDPAVDIYNKLPQQKFDVVFSNDVLEHIEPIYLDNVLKYIEQTSNKYAWLRIDTQPANKTLTDGRNAHLIIENEAWWKERIEFAMNMKIVNIYTNKKQRIDVELVHG